MKLRPEEAKSQGTEWWVVKRTTNTESNEVMAMSSSLQAVRTVYYTPLWECIIYIVYYINIAWYLCVLYKLLW